MSEWTITENEWLPMEESLPPGPSGGGAIYFKEDTKPQMKVLGIEEEKVKEQINQERLIVKIVP